MSGRQLRTWIGVECRFASDGTVDIRRVYYEGKWLPVSQGRQWVDRLGRHVLIMLPENDVRELCLRPDTLTWELVDLERRDATIV